MKKERPPLSQEAREKIRQSKIGKPRDEETRRKISIAHKGKKISEETREKLRKRMLGNKICVGRFDAGKRKKRCDCGEKSAQWKGGITPENKKIRTSLEYKLWRKSVFERDNFTCIWCGSRGVELHADHIKPFSLFPELRFAIDNGRTLCVPCHEKTDTYKGRARKLKQ